MGNLLSTLTDKQYIAIDVSSDESRSEDEIPAKKPTPKTAKPKPLGVDLMSDEEEEIPATKSISVKGAAPEPMDEDDAEDGSEDDNGEE